MINTKTPRALTLLTLAALSLGVSACNTVKGIGQDIESVGEAGEDALDSAKE